MAIRSDFINVLGADGGEKEIIIPPSVTSARVEVPGGTVTCQGKMTKNGKFYPLMGVASNDFGGKLAMTQGLWMIECSGLWSIRINYSGGSEPLNLKLLY